MVRCPFLHFELLSINPYDDYDYLCLETFERMGICDLKPKYICNAERGKLYKHCLAYKEATSPAKQKGYHLVKSFEHEANNHTEHGDGTVKTKEQL